MNGTKTKLGYENDAKIPSWGYDFPVLVDMMKTTLDKLIKKNEKFVLCIHDWGCLVGLLYQNTYPTNIEKVAMFDVGTVDTLPPFKDLFIMSIYQVNTGFKTSFTL